MFIRNLLFTAIIITLPVSHALASNEHVKIPSQAWSFSGVFGIYDKASLQRGYKIYRNICSGCHSMKRVHFRDLTALGYNEAQIKNIAAEYSVEDGPNDDGEMFERPARPSDAFISPFPNKKAAMAANGGAAPPDLSLITKARANGPNYVYALLTGFKEDAPNGEEVPDGQHWNTYFPGHKLSMAPPLMDGAVEYEDGSPETLEQYAGDIVNFLMWTADPHMEDRKRAGIKSILFLVIFASLMLAVKRKIWSKMH